MYSIQQDTSYIIYEDFYNRSTNSAVHFVQYSECLSNALDFYATLKNNNYENMYVKNQNYGDVSQNCAKKKNSF